MRTKKTMKGRGESKPLSKLEVLDKYPKIADALQQFAAERQSGSGRMMGGGWWDDFVNWLSDNKVISTASKIGSVIAGAFGAVPLATALSAVSAGSAALGYGRPMVGNGYVNNLSRIGTKSMKGKGMSQDARYVARAILGKGEIYSQNGMLVKQPKMSGGCGCGKMMGGATTQYNTVSTEFSEVKFR